MDRTQYEENVIFAVRHNWTPDQVGEMPADFVDEMIIYYKAEAKHRKKEEAKAEKKARKKHG